MFAMPSDLYPNASMFATAKSPNAQVIQESNPTSASTPLSKSSNLMSRSRGSSRPRSMRPGPEICVYPSSSSSSSVAKNPTWAICLPTYLPSKDCAKPPHHAAGYAADAAAAGLAALVHGDDVGEGVRAFLDGDGRDVVFVGVDGGDDLHDGRVEGRGGCLADFGAFCGVGGGC